MSWLNSTREWCSEIEKSWIIQRDALEFHEFATEALSNRDFLTGFDLNELIKDFFKKSNELPQLNSFSNFGDVPLTLYLSREHNIVLDLYVWLDSHTSIHGHGFEGAFKVIQGSSLEGKYDFEKKSSANNCHWGQLIPRELRLLGTGDTRPILRGEQMIHKVLHLDRPTVSLALRTASNNDKLVQLTYSFGRLANPSFPPDDIVTKLKILDWYLNHMEQLPKDIFLELSDYAQFWLKIFMNKKMRTLGQKYSHIKGAENLLEDYERQASFEIPFGQLTLPFAKLLLGAYEFLGPEKWEDWMRSHHPYSGNLKETLIENLQQTAFSKEHALKDNFLYSPLFIK